MRKICIELETDSEESLEAIKQDLKMEISCCYNNFEISSIKETELGEHNIVEGLIDRQAVINQLKQLYWDKKVQSAKDDPCIVDAMIDLAIRIVKSVPSEDNHFSKQAAINPLEELKELDYELYIRTGYSHLTEEQWDFIIKSYKENLKKEMEQVQND